jgi:uncharacterized protein
MFSRKLESQLDSWLVDKARKPLVLRGARQVGKTTLVHSWSKKKSLRIVNINLDNVKERMLFQSLAQGDMTIDLEDCLRLIDQNYVADELPLGSHLIFFDEIQNVPGLIPLLRAFYEQRPDLMVIAAGSYLEIKLNRLLNNSSIDFAFPLGRIDSLYIYPLDFFEFLVAKGKNKLLDALKDLDWKKSVPKDIHILATQEFEEYFFYGGMPEVVHALTQKASNDRMMQIYNNLINGYLEDISKYEVRDSSVKYLEHVLFNAPKFAGSTITYAGFAESSYGSREISKAFGILESVMLLSLAHATSSESLPWITQEKRGKKLIYLDTGLVNFASNLRWEQVHRADLNELYRGRIAEQVVGQQLLSDECFAKPILNYWAKDYNIGKAEIDFCLQVDGRPVGIEVKSGNTGSLKSLFEFAKKVDGTSLFRVYSGIMQESSHQGFMVRSIPFYLLPRLRELV